jgi:large subunit ribosomal protein L3
MKFILGKKLSMTQIWRNDLVVPVTRIQVEPCVITQIKTVQVDGYRAVQLATGQRKVKNIAKPQRGHFGAWGNFQYLREFNLDQEKEQSEANWQAGQQVALSSFVPGDRVQVTSTSKGRGFQGGVKRHGFHGQGRTHGVKDQQRMPGSVGATGPAHIFKGTRMAGRMGGEQVTVKNLEVVEIDEQNGFLYLKGAVPGWSNGWVAVTGLGQMVIAEKNEIKDNDDNKIIEPIDEPAEEMVTEAVVEVPAEEPAAEAIPEVVAETPAEEVANSEAEANNQEAA